MTKAERDAGAAAAPVIDLRFAAGAFSDAQALEDGADDWVALPDWVRPQPGLLVAQVLGESMNRRIPNGAWCLFRANPTGTRRGKVVVVQHRSIADPETGGGTPSSSTRARRCRTGSVAGGMSASRRTRIRIGQSTR